MVAQGKVRYTGVSNFAAWQTAKALGVSALNGWTSFQCIQPMYNLVKRQAEVEILQMNARVHIPQFVVFQSNNIQKRTYM
mgnify:CR=1 FL=1